MLHNETVRKICGVEFGHPLLCPPVVEHIFKDLELEELKTCRLVCQHWNAMSLLQMKNSRRRPKVQISLSDGNMEQFLNNETELCEFQHFKFNYSMTSEPNMKEYLNVSRNQHKHITFVIRSDHANEDVNFNSTDKFLSFLAENSNNLKSFGIDTYKHGHQILPTPTMEFESFQIDWTKLRCLVIWFHVDSPIFLRILEKASKLEKLVVYEGSYNLYHKFLENLINTLIELEFYEDTPNPASGWNQMNHPHNIDHTLPRFTKLKRLKIRRRLNRSYILTIPSLPELSELHLESDAVPRPHFEDLAIFPKLKFLVWNWSYNCLTDDDNVKKFPVMFPNLKRFRTRQRGTYHTVWKYLRGIEELSCSSLDDMAIIGFDPDTTLTLATNNPDSNDHNPHKEYADWSVIYNRERNKGFTKEKNNQDGGIQVLPELKRLTVSVHLISNASIIFGLLKCKSLRSVQLLLPSPFLTKEILVWMADELNLMNLSIDVGNRDWYASTEANYFRQKHPNCQLVFPYYPTKLSRFTDEQKKKRTMLDWNNIVTDGALLY